MDPRKPHIELCPGPCQARQTQNGFLLVTPPGGGFVGAPSALDVLVWSREQKKKSRGMDFRLSEFVMWDRGLWVGEFQAFADESN